MPKILAVFLGYANTISSTLRKESFFIISLLPGSYFNPICASKFARFMKSITLL